MLKLTREEFEEMKQDYLSKLKKLKGVEPSRPEEMIASIGAFLPGSAELIAWATAFSYNIGYWDAVEEMEAKKSAESGRE